MVTERHVAEVAVLAWLERRLSGFTVIYSPQSHNVALPPRPFATVRLIGTQKTGQGAGAERNYRENTEDSTEVLIDLRSFYLATVSIQIASDSPETHMERLRAGLADPDELAAFEVNGCEIIDLSGEVDSSVMVASDYVRRRAADVTVAYASHYLTAAPALATVEIQPGD